MKKYTVLKTIFNFAFLVYGILGLLGFKVIPASAALATYMIVYFGVVYGIFNLREVEESKE